MSYLSSIATRPMDGHHEGLAEVIGKIYETGSDQTGLREVLTRLQNLFDASRACLTKFVDGSTNSIQVIEDREFLCDEALDSFRRDPFSTAALRMPVAEAFLQDEVADCETFRRGELFSDWYAPRDMYSGLSGILNSDNGGNWFLDVQRGQHQKPFDREDVRALDLIIPHLMRAWSLTSRIMREGIETAIAAMDDPVFMIDPDGRVETMNENARILLGQKTAGLHISTMKQLRGRDSRESHKIREILSDARNKDLSDKVQLFMRAGEDDTCQAPSSSGVLLRAIRLPASGLTPPDRVPVLLSARVVAGPETRGLSELIVQEFDLTPAEARIALAMASGLPLKEIALLSGISFNTARFHLRQIFAKTGTKQQSQLVALLRPL